VLPKQDEDQLTTGEGNQEAVQDHKLHSLFLYSKEESFHDSGIEERHDP
jgi:hypothetical protein